MGAFLGSRAPPTPSQRPDSPEELSAGGGARGGGLGWGRGEGVCGDGGQLPALDAKGSESVLRVGCKRRTSHGDVPGNPAVAFCLPEVECKPREQLIITPFKKARRAPRVHPHLAPLPLLRRRPAKHRGIRCLLFPSAAAPSPGGQLTPEPADAASPRSSSRLPAASAPTICVPPSWRFDSTLSPSRSRHITLPISPPLQGTERSF